MDLYSFAVVLSACSTGADSAEKPAAAPAGQVRRIALVYGVNNFGNTEPVGCPHKTLHDGGLARRLAFIRQESAAGRPVLVLDGGSTFFPEVDKPKDEEREKLFLKAELIAEGMNRMGYKAMAMGSTDLLLGMGELTHLAGQLKFPILAANFTVPSGTKGPPFKAHTVLDAGGVRVGVLGLLLETMGKVYLSKVAPGCELSPARPAAQRAVEELRGKADLIVALSHVSMDTNRELAAEVPGIDIVIDPSIEYGNHHPRIQDKDWLEVVKRTAIVRADGNGSSLGVLEIDFRKPGLGMAFEGRIRELEAKEAEGKLEEAEKAELEDLRGRNLFVLRRIPLSPHYADDPEAASLLDAHRTGVDLKAVPAAPAPAVRAEYLTAGGCRDCHQKQHDNWMTTKHYNAFEPIRASGQDRKPECISCHTTGYGLAFVDPGEASTFNGVQCEACHGTRPEHAKDPAGQRFGAVAESTCLPCHNEDVVKKDFSYRVALRRVQCPSGK